MCVCFVVAIFSSSCSDGLHYYMLQHSPSVSNARLPKTTTDAGLPWRSVGRFCIVCPKFPVVFKVCHSTLNALTLGFAFFVLLFLPCWLIWLGFGPDSLRYLISIPPSSTITWQTRTTKSYLRQTLAHFTMVYNISHIKARIFLRGRQERERGSFTQRFKVSHTTNTILF